MAHSTLLLLALSIITQLVLIVNVIGQQSLVPAVYVFGDSTVDAGNNNHLNTLARADKWPYGIDFNNVRGRFSNGKNGADFLAIYLGLPMPPPYLNLSDPERGQITTGINYASGACGILNTTREGECLSLAQQVEYFTLTATKDLPKALNNQKKLHQHLSNSIYLLLIGNNDYVPQLNGNITDKFSSEGFADYLLNEMTKHIKTLYDLGARKFVVSGLSICNPHNYSEPSCKSRYYADKLPHRLQDLQNELSNLLFTIYDGSNLYNDIFENPEKYGFTKVKVACSQEGTICPDRSKYNQFDRYGHQTEASNEIASKECFNGTACSPITLFELAKAPIKHDEKEIESEGRNEL